MIRLLAFGSGAFAILGLVASLLGLGVYAIAAMLVAGASGIAAGLSPATTRTSDHHDETISEVIPVESHLELEASRPDPSEAQESPTARPAAPTLVDARLRIRFARAIASQVPTMTEEAAFALIARFESMRANTSKAASSARDFKATLNEGQASGRAPVEVQAEKTRGVIKSQRESIAIMTDHNRKGAKDLRAMGNELESGMDLLKGIEEITERSRLIAFNMAVEAARIGEKGRGFRVIVGELRKLNDQTADFSRKVADLLVRFRDYNESVVARLAEETDRVAKDVQGGMRAAEEAVESLITASGTADRFAREVSALVEVIDGDLDGVLESLQFQDITRQMIEGALAALDEAGLDVDKSMESLGLAAGAATDLARREQIRKSLLDRSKTKGEKTAIMEVDT